CQRGGVPAQPWPISRFLVQLRLYYQDNTFTASAESAPIGVRADEIVCMIHGNCPTQADLTAFNLGELLEGDQDRIAAHLETCARCEAAAQALDGVTDPWISGLRQSSRANAVVEQAPLPEQIGDYQVLEEIGRGG